MYDKIVEMMCEQFDLTPDAISEETSFVDDLGIDSLDVVELVMELRHGRDPRGGAQENAHRRRSRGVRHRPFR